MKKIKIISMFILLSAVVTAEAFTQLKSDYVAKCVNDGENKATCECSFDQFTQQAPAAQKSNTTAFLKGFISGKQPTIQEMQAFQPLMMLFQQVGYQCASQTIAQEPDISDQMDMTQLMGGQLPAEAAELMKQFMNQNNADVLKNINDMDKSQSSNRQDKREKEKQQRRQEEEKRNALYKQLKQEDNRLYKQSLITLDVNDYKKAMDLHLQIQGYNQAQKECIWQTLQSSAGQGAASSLTAYFVIFGGDFDKPESFRPYMQQAEQNYHRYNNNVAKCS